MMAVQFVIADAEPHELAHATARVGKHGQHRSVPDSCRNLTAVVLDLRCLKQTSAVMRRETDGLSISRNGWSLHKLPVGWVGSGVAVGLQVREERPESR